MATEEILNLFRFWCVANRRCVLVAVEGHLELRLYERQNLVGLEICQDVEHALVTSQQWYEHPPTWPPY
jgi:hypothetical protein